MDFTDLKDRIKDVLRGMNGVSVDENGFYYCECDKDYRDELSDEQVADVLAGKFRFRVDGKERFEKMEPRNVLYNILAEGYQEEMWRIEDEVLGEVKKNADVARVMNEIGIDEVTLAECLRDVFYVSVPVDDYLKQDVCMDILLDTGDANHEFTCNNLLDSDIEGVEDFDDDSSLLWLCEQQGVSREELLAAFEKGTAHSDEVVRLQERKDAIVSELRNFGFQESRLGEPVTHTGAYQEYAGLQAKLVRLTKEIQRLSTKRAENAISYPEYLKQHFDRFERLDPMSEAQFEVRKAEVLERFDAKLEAANKEYAQVKDRLDFGTDYRRIAILQSEYKGISRHLKGLAETDEYKKAEFVDSVCEEMHNMSSDVGAVTFLVKMPLEEAMRVQEVMDGEAALNDSYEYGERTGKSVIVLGKDVRCGLFDTVNGGGSVFEIGLLKDVEIPVRAIGEFGLDAARGEWAFMSIYGTNDELFEESLKEIKVAPQMERVEDVISVAVERCGGAMSEYKGFEGTRDLL